MNAQNTGSVNSEVVESQPMLTQESDFSTEESASHSNETSPLTSQHDATDNDAFDHEDPYGDFPTAETPETPVVIQAGERRFTTFRTTLIQGSSYYRSLFSGNWRNCPQADGSYFVDIDGDYFAHLLRFLRHRVYPKGIYNAEEVIDKEYYKGLLDAAPYLGVEGLYEWLRDGKYLRWRD